MESKEYLSVSDFAAAAGVSTQYIYRQLNNEKAKLRNYLSTIEGKKKIEKSALFDIFGIESINKIEKQVEKQVGTAAASNDLLQSLMEQLKEKDKQLEEKDKQIEKLLKLNDQQLEEKDKQIEKLLKINDQQQQLTLSLQKYMIDLNKRFPIEDYPEGEIMLAKEKQEEFDKMYEKVVEEVKKEKQELKDLRKYKEEHERKGFFKRLFRK